MRERELLLEVKAQRFLTQRIIPLKEKKSRAEVEREVVKGIKDKNYPRNAERKKTCP